MNAVGIFIFGVFVTMLVATALGLLGWGLLTEWREGSIDDAGGDASGKDAATGATSAPDEPTHVNEASRSEAHGTSGSRRTPGNAS